MLLAVYAAAVVTLTAVFVNAALYAVRHETLRRLAVQGGPAPIGLLDAAVAFLGECVALAAVVLLVPLGCAMRRRHGAAAGRGTVLLVPDWCLNRGSLWCLRRRLLRDGWGPVICVAEYNPGADFEGAAARLRDQIMSLPLPTGRPVTLVGHGLGGLVVRECARLLEHGAVRRIVTLGTPHAGTQLARHVPFWGRAVAPQAAPMRRLRAERAVASRYDVVAIHSVFDATVLPPDAAMYPGAFNVQINGAGHYALLFSARVYGLLAENLAAPLPDA